VQAFVQLHKRNELMIRFFDSDLKKSEMPEAGSSSARLARILGRHWGGKLGEVRREKYIVSEERFAQGPADVTPILIYRGKRHGVEGNIKQGRIERNTAKQVTVPIVV